MNRKPDGICDGEGVVPDAAVRPLDSLINFVENYGEITLTPANDRVRVLHYIGENDVYMMVNESSAVYHGSITVPTCGECYAYNAYDNRLEIVETTPISNGTAVSIVLEPLKSLIIVFGSHGHEPLHAPLTAVGTPRPLCGWTRSQCRSIDYPVFENARAVTLPDTLAEEQPKFSGFARYEADFTVKAGADLTLCIENASEGVEVFVNGVSLGITIAPPMLYDLRGHVRNGENTLTIEVATTLERERAAAVDDDPVARLMAETPIGHSGLTGAVTLYEQEEITVE